MLFVNTKNKKKNNEVNWQNYINSKKKKKNQYIPSK